MIPLKEGGKPFKKKTRSIDPNLKPLVKIKVEKMKKACIIFPTKILS